MPLVHAGGDGEEALDARGERARKVLPRFARGELERVAVGLNSAEAELLQGILLEEGIPSILRRTGGFDVPDFLAAGPRDVLVPASGAATARELLGTEDDLPERESTRRAAMKIAAGMLIGLLLFGALTGLLLALLA